MRPGHPVCHCLMYHDVVEGDRDASGFEGPLAAAYKLDRSAFERHLDAIAARGLRPAVAAGRAVPPPCAISFDDGGRSALDTAAALERRGWRGYYFVTTGRIGRPGFLSAAGVRELSDRGHAVGAHSHSHPTYMGRLTRTQIADEWSHSRAELGELLGAAPDTASVPGGFLSGAVVDEARRAGFAALFTSEPVARVRRRGDLWLVGRYAVRADTPAEAAAALAAGRRIPRARLWTGWRARSGLKRAIPAAAYERGRRLVASRR